MDKIGIIFDLDGTLWDTVKTTYKAANDIAKENNLKEVTVETVINGMGKVKEYNAKNYYPEVELDKGLKLLDQSSDKNTYYLKRKEAIIYPDVEKTLQELSKKYDLYIVSNCFDNDYINTFKSYLDVIFKDFVATGTLNINKAEGIKLIIKRNNLDKAIYVGDTILDYDSSKEANIPFIYAKYGFGNIDKYEYSINDIKELINVIPIILEK